jgi:hypothetical protein
LCSGYGRECVGYLHGEFDASSSSGRRSDYIDEFGDGAKGASLGEHRGNGTSGHVYCFDGSGGE